MISRRSCVFLSLLALGLIQLTLSQTDEDGVFAAPPGKVAEPLRRRFRREVAEAPEGDSDKETTTRKVVTTKVIEERTRTPKARPQKTEDNQETTTVVKIHPKIIHIKKTATDDDDNEKDVPEKVKIILKGPSKKIYRLVKNDKPTKDNNEDDEEEKKVTIMKPVHEETIVTRRIYKLGENGERTQVKGGNDDLVKRKTVVVNEESDIPKETIIKIVRPVEKKTVSNKKASETEGDTSSTTETVVTTTREKSIHPKPAEEVQVQVLKVDEAPETGTVIKTRERILVKPKETESESKESKVPVKKVSEPAEEPVVMRRSRPKTKESLNVEDVDVSKSESTTETVITTRGKKLISQGKKSAEDDVSPPTTAEKVVTVSERTSQPQPATLPLARPVILPGNDVPQTPNAVGPLSLLNDSFVKNKVTPANLFAKGVFTTA